MIARLSFRISLLPAIIALAIGGSVPLGAQVINPQAAPYGAAPPNPYGRPVSRDLRAYPPGYYPGKLVQPAPQQSFSLRRLFGLEDQSPPLQIPQRSYQAHPARPRSVPPVSAVAKQEKPKLGTARQVAVFGDALADLVSQGIEDLYADMPDVAVVRKTKADAGLVRPDLADWPKLIRDTLDNGKKIDVAVVMMGADDRQPIKDGNETDDPLSDKWREIYRGRIDAIAKVFQERNVPLVWIGLPAMKSDKLSEDLIAMNEIARESVQRLSGTYVDIWPGFVDEDNHYTPAGPDVEGQIVRLRTNDGIFFTKAGARKAAHFADEEIKRILESGKTTSAAASASPAAPAGVGGDAAIEAALPAPPAPAAAPVLPAKPMIGPVLPLTRSDPVTGQALISEPLHLDGDQAYSLKRALRDGASSPPPPGRADDFRWPPPS